MSDLEKAFELISKSTAEHEKRQKFLQNSIKALEGEFQASSSEHKVKMQNLKTANDKEVQELTSKNEPLRITIANLKSELESLKLQIDAAKISLKEQVTARKVNHKETVDALNAEVNKKRLELDGINHAIKEAKRMIGVS